MRTANFPVRITALAACLFAFGLLGRSAADTPVSGTISTNTTWTTAGSPYVLTGSVFVEGAGTPVLTIQPGVTVKFNSAAALLIGNGSAGSLSAVGTSGSLITFTANGSTTPGFWYGIRLQANATATTIAYATVSYGGQASTYGGITVTGSSPTIQNVTSQNSNDSGIRINGGSPTITNCTLTNNPWGLVPYGTGSPNVSGTTISNNTAGGIYLLSPTVTSLQTVTIANNTGYAITQDAKVTLGTVSGLTVTGNTTNGIEVRGSTADVNTTWKKVGVPYILSGYVYVEKNGTPTPVLTIEAGTTVKFNAGIILAIGNSYAGSLSAVGTSVSPITFTANGSTTPGFWYGIRLQANATATTIAYATVSYGGQASTYGGITVTGSSPTIQNVTSQNSNELRHPHQRRFADDHQLHFDE